MCQSVIAVVEGDSKLFGNDISLSSLYTGTHADSAEIDTDRPGNSVSLNMKILKFPNTHSPAPHQQQCMNIYIL